jgi:hypothetical protein
MKKKTKTEIKRELKVHLYNSEKLKETIKRTKKDLKNIVSKIEIKKFLNFIEYLKLKQKCLKWNIKKCKEDLKI